MAGKKIGNARIALLLFVLLLAAQACFPAACAEDEELLKRLPGQWIFSLSADEQAEGADAPQADAAFLTLGEGGAMSLLCHDKAGEYICTYEGTWTFQFVPDGMDQLTLLFTSTDHPAQAGLEYRVECVYNAYTESWDEDDTQHTYLLLEEARSSGVSPFEAVYGEDGRWPLGLHREQGPNMQVVNCKNYVSLRAKRSKSAARLAKVPLGAKVLAFPEAGEENGFIFCLYHGEYGYILTEYLQPVQ